ncbi:6526_t:CDS:2 [Cetraspora pellucida]|uniref:6526_t:CDS:1 n=1 Tax=Cetraspora pellucida TaxID=1433469 RepID=A0ACA9NVV0_9GLOM|nr:6526_t:CDS:2 [Cetraspora pellucida]
MNATNALWIKISPPAEIAGPTSRNFGLTQHGLKDKRRTYRFYLKLYDYDQKPVLLLGRHKLDATTGQLLPPNQHIFRSYNYQTKQTTYFYRTNEQLVGHAASPVLIKKNYRLGTRTLNPLNLLKLASKHAEFLHTPLEQDQVPKEVGQCNQLIYTHFQTKPVLHFSFLPENAPLVRSFIAKLDDYATEYNMTESQEFYSYPITHDTKHEVAKNLDGTCPCDPIRSRNQYLDN